jgi:hypothetical protein
VGTEVVEDTKEKSHPRHPNKKKVYNPLESFEIPNKNSTATRRKQEVDEKKDSNQE